MNTPPDEPTLEQEIYEIRLLLNKANQSIPAGMPVDLPDIESRIKSLTDNLVAQISDLEGERRNNLLEALKAITVEIGTLEKTIQMTAPGAPETPEQTNPGQTAEETET